MPTIIRKLLDEVFVSIPQLIFRHSSKVKPMLGVMFDEVGERPVTQSVFIRPARIPKDAIEGIFIGTFNGPHSILYGYAYIGGGFSYVIPMGSFGYDKMMVFSKGGVC